MLKLADINAQLHNVLYLTLNTPIREKRIAGSPTSQGKCPTDKVQQFPNFRTIIPIVSAFWSQFPTCHHCPVQHDESEDRQTIRREDGVNVAHGLYI